MSISEVTRLPATVTGGVSVRSCSEVTISSMPSIPTSTICRSTSL